MESLQLEKKYSTPAFDGNEILDLISCGICFELPSSALETTCCSNIICEICHNNITKSCPYCNLKVYSVRPSGVVRKNKIEFDRYRCNDCDLDFCENCLKLKIEKEEIKKKSHSNNSLEELSSLSSVNEEHDAKSEKENKTIPEKLTYTHISHPHPLIPDFRDNGWCCDGSKWETKCKSGINGFYQTTGMKRFRCYKCDYDLCEKCLIWKGKY